MSYIPANYIEKTYAGWLGKVIGIRLGAPIEGWSYEDIKKIYGEINNYLVDYRDFAADDDSNGPLFFIRALEDYTYTREITSKEMGLTWLNYTPEYHSFFWWGGYGVSTEHTAYENLKNGIHAPRSGSIKQNGLVCAEQIGGQIFIDCWGLVLPNNPKLAAEYASKAASVSHDGNGKYGAMFVAACISAAYTAKSIIEMIKEGLKVIPEDCDYVRVVKKVLNFYINDKEKNWKKCYSYIKDNFWINEYGGCCHIIPNAALMILSMLYGEGDFSKTQIIINMCGFDTDCNAGNVGTILGVYVGIKGIEEKWYKPINDLMIASSVIGSLNISNLPENVNLFCNLGYKIAGEEPPEEWKDIIANNHSKFHFEYPTSTHSFRVKCDNNNLEITLMNSNEEAHTGNRSLKVIVNNAVATQDIKIYHKTFYEPKDLHDTRYDPAFSPILYPGQTVSAYIYNPTEYDINVCLYVEERNTGEIYCSKSMKLNKEWTPLTYHIPALKGGVIKEIGIIVTPREAEINKFYMYIDDFDFQGQPNYSIEFDKERYEDFGSSKVGPHIEISQFTQLNGLWELEGNYLSGSCADRGEAYTGNYDWTDYTLKATLQPQIGSHHNINFRVQGGIRSYALGLAPNNKLCLYKNNNGYNRLNEVHYEWHHSTNYTFTIKLLGNRIIISDANNILIDYQDNDKPYLYGQIGVSVLNGSHCHYKEFEIK